MNHMNISLVKSGIRIATCIVAAILPTDTAIVVLALGLAVAELLGILEEIFDKRKEL